MSKKMSKKSRVNLICFLIAAAISAVIIFVFLRSVTITGDKTNDTANTSDTIDDTVDAEPDYSLFVSISSQDVLDFISEDKTGFIYIGRPTCPSCQKFVPILTTIIRQKGYTVYYYDTDAANSDKDLKSEVLNLTNVTSVPTFMYIESGEIAAELDDITSKTAIFEFINSRL